YDASQPNIVKDLYNTYLLEYQGYVEEGRRGRGGPILQNPINWIYTDNNGVIKPIYMKDFKDSDLNKFTEGDEKTYQISASILKGIIKNLDVWKNEFIYLSST